MFDLIGEQQTIHLPPVRLRRTMARLKGLRQTLDLIYHERSHDAVVEAAFDPRARTDADAPNAKPRRWSDESIERIGRLRLEAINQNEELLTMDLPVLLGERYEARLWRDVVHPGRTIIESLEHAAGSHDFGLFVLHPDDIRVSGSNVHDVPRDNVLFEFGVFVGRTSRHHAFILTPKSVALPTDLEGIVVEHDDPHAPDLRKSLADGCKRVRAAIERLVGARPDPVS